MTGGLLRLRHRPSDHRAQPSRIDHLAPPNSLRRRNAEAEHPHGVSGNIPRVACVAMHRRDCDAHIDIARVDTDDDIA